MSNIKKASRITEHVSRSDSLTEIYSSLARSSLEKFTQRDLCDIKTFQELGRVVSLVAEDV
ncbi:MAG: hypothetical protein NZM26_04900 [Patescibacteria group bacterium]|nr:hypothetical protein [Patescibacteria group bacterium]